MYPNYFCKYRSLSGNSLKFTKDLVVNRRIYFAGRNELNDPHELKPILDCKSNRYQRVKFFKRINRREFPGLNRAALARKIKHQLKDDLALITQKAFDMVVSEVGVFSTTPNNDDASMWDRYADEHKGVCILLDPDVISTEDIACSITASPYFGAVNYQPNKPVYNHIIQAETDMFRTTFLTKSTQWRGEDEWRVVLSRGAGRAVRYPRGLVQGIILGAKICAEHRNEVLSWQKETGDLLQFYQASIPDDAYGITISPL